MDGMDRYTDRQTDRQTDKCCLPTKISHCVFYISKYVRNMCKSCAEFRASVALAPR